MPQMGWIFDKSRCVGCRACTVACKMENNTPTDVNWRWVYDLEAGAYPDPSVEFYSTACYHCESPACMASCPTDAITKDAQTGLVQIAQAQCVGCKYCIAACPYGAVQFNAATKKVDKCTGCVQRVEVGLAPACVVTCVGGALQWVQDAEWGGTPPEGFAPMKHTKPSVKFEG